MPYSTLNKQVGVHGCNIVGRYTYTLEEEAREKKRKLLNRTVPTLRVEEMAQAESPLLYNFPVSHDPGKDHKDPG